MGSRWGVLNVGRGNNKPVPVAPSRHTPMVNLYRLVKDYESGAITSILFRDWLSIYDCCIVCENGRMNIRNDAPVGNNGVDESVEIFI